MILPASQPAMAPITRIIRMRIRIPPAGNMMLLPRNRPKAPIFGNHTLVRATWRPGLAGRWHRVQRYAGRWRRVAFGLKARSAGVISSHSPRTLRQWPIMESSTLLVTFEGTDWNGPWPDSAQDPLERGALLAFPS